MPPDWRCLLAGAQSQGYPFSLRAVLPLSEQTLPLLALLSVLQLAPQVPLQISGALIRKFWTLGIF